MHTTASINGEDFDVIFDTGADGLVLDIAYFQGIAQEDSIRKGVAYFPASNRRITCDIVQQGIDIVLAGQVLHFDEFVLDNLQDRLGVLAMVSIPEHDKRVWNFDYENRILSILDTIPETLDTFEMITSSVRRVKEDIFVSLPLSLVNSVGDTLSWTVNGVFDTGSARHLIAYGSLNVLGNKKMAHFLAGERVFLKSGTDKKLFCLNQTSPHPGKFFIEVNPGSHTAVLVLGNSLLSHYKIWLDLGCERMYATPVKQYISPYQDFFASRQFEFRTIRTDRGMLIDYCRSGTRSWAAGLREGDLIVKVDDKSYHHGITRKDIFEFEDGQTQHCVSVIRNSDTLSVYFTPEITE